MHKTQQVIVTKNILGSLTPCNPNGYLLALAATFTPLRYLHDYG
jgi:hypothetical protein